MVTTSSNDPRVLWRNIILVLLCALGLYYRYDRRAFAPISPDEWHHLGSMQGNFAHLLHEMQRKEFFSFLSGDMYLIYPFFKIFGTSNIWGLAIPHILSTLVGFYLLYKVCGLYFKTHWAYVLAFTVVCFNATLINHAFEIRVYAVLPTMALAIFYVTHKLIYGIESFTRRQKIWFGVFFVLAIWFHVYGILMVFFSCLYCLADRLREPRFKEVFIKAFKFFSVILLITMPLYLISVFGQHAQYYEGLDPFQYIPNPLADPFGFFKGIFCNLIGSSYLYGLFVGIILMFFIPQPNRYKQIAFLLIMIIIPILVVMISEVKHGYWFVQRHFIWVMPWFAVLLGWVWESIVMTVRQKVTLGRI